MSATAVLFILVFFAALLLSFLKHPKYGLFAYLWVFYNHPPSRWWGQTLPDLRWSLLAAVVTLISVIIFKRAKKVKWSRQFISISLILFALWLWIENSWALDTKLHQEGCILITKYVVLSYLFFTIVEDLSVLRFIAWTHVTGCFILGWIARAEAGGGRLEGVGGPGIDDANTLAMQLATGVVMGGFLLFIQSGYKKWFSLPALAFILNGIILASSRGAMLGLVGGGFVATLFSPTKIKKWLFIVIPLAVVMLNFLAHDIFWERWSSIWEKDESGEYEESAQSRFVIIKAGLQMAKDYPLGAGHRGHNLLSPKYIPEEYLAGNGMRAAHNTVMAVLVEFGFVGLALYSFLIIGTGIDLLKLCKIKSEKIQIYAIMLLTAFCCYFIAGQFSNYIKAEVWIWIVGLTQALKKIHITANDSPGLAQNPGRQVYYRHG